MKRKQKNARRWIWPVLSIGAGLILGICVSFVNGAIIAKRLNRPVYMIELGYGYSGRPGTELFGSVGLSFDASEVVSQVNGSVVTVIAYSESYWYGDGSTGYSLGSGVIFREDDEWYYLLTNAHVVDACVKATLYFRGSAQPDVIVMGSNLSEDVAVLCVRKQDIPDDILAGLCCAQLGDSDSLHRGDYVVAIGTPTSLSYMNTVTVGVVSGLSRKVRVEGHERLYLQIDAALNPGNSGGALFDAEGHLIGINSAKVRFVYGINLTLPINQFMQTAEKIIKGSGK